MRRRRVFLAIASLVALATATGAARADDDSRFVVASEGCDALHPREIERVLAVELHGVVRRYDAQKPLRVELSCDDARLAIVAIDAITDKRLSREVDLPPRMRDRDRVVAILVSQLFLTSWSELLLPPPPDVPAIEAAPAPAVEDARAEARAAVGEPRGARASIVAVVGPRLRSFGAPILGGRASARPSILLGDHLRLALDLGYERGSVARGSSAVGYSAASASAFAALRSGSLGPLAFEAGAMAGVAYADVHGDAAPPSSGAEASGAIGEAAIAFGPRLDLGGAALGLELTAGLTFPRFAGRVEGGSDVILGGPFAGASLVLGFGEEAR